MKTAKAADKIPNWSRPADLRAQLQKLWDRGELLAQLVDGENLFPKRLSLKSPSSSEIADRYQEVRVWAKQIMGTAHCRIEMREFSHRVVGSNAIPNEVWVDSLPDALAMLGKQKEATQFCSLLEITQQRQPLLSAWLAKKPLKALELVSHWPALLDIVTWLQDHPKPGIYLRQVDIPGINSKFIESQQRLLTELFDLTLPQTAINLPCTGSSQFNLRYGFKEKPPRIRFRVLDPSKSPFLSGGTPDITLDSTSFAKLPALVGRIFITENETNFLAFPEMADSLVIFGAGYGWDSLAQATWLADSQLFYWGDIDTHGFAILNQLRSRFAHVASFMMDKDTLMMHQALWGHEPDQARQDLAWLNADEQAVYDDLRDNRIRANLRLEQEMIGFNWMQNALLRIVAD